MITTIKKYFTPPNFSSKEIPDLGKTLHYITITIVLGLMYPTVSNILVNISGSNPDIRLSIILLFQLLLTFVCFLLNKNGYSIVISRILPFSFIPFQLGMISTSQFNVYDVAMWTYGPVFILASSLLEKRWYIIFTIAQLLSISYHYGNELSRMTIPGYSSAQIWNDYFDSLSINVVTAVGAFILSSNVLRNFRKANENALSANAAQQRLNLIFETSPEGIAIFDNRGVITFTNKVAKNVLEVIENADESDPQSGISWKVLSVEGNEIPHSDYPHVIVQKTKTPIYNNTIQIQFPDKRKKVLRLSAAPWFNENNIVDGSIITFQDITDQLRLEEELELRREQITSITSNLGSVIYRVQLQKGKIIKPLYISEGAKELFGYSANELMGDIRKFMSAIYRVDAMKDIQTLRELIENPKPFDYEYRVISKSGEIRWQKNSGRPFVLPDGSVAVDGFVVDITEQKELQQQLQMLGQAVNNSSEMIFMTDVRGLFIFVNARFTKTYGYLPEEIIGKETPVILEHTPNTLVTEKTLWHDLEQLKIITTTFVNKTKNNIVLEVESSISPIIDKNGKLQGYLSIQRDITERKKIEEAIQQSKKMESLSILAGGVAHEFNNLLTAILGRATYHQQKVEIGSSIHSALVKIEEAALRASDLTRQLLAYSGRSKFEIRIVNINDIIKENIRFVNVSNASVQIHTDLTEEILPIRADIRQIKQLIINITTNALEAATKTNNEIIIRTTKQSLDSNQLEEWKIISKTTMVPGEYVIIEVHDNGVGMNDDVKRKIFDPFFTTKFTGRGLGLSAVIGILQGHHGGVIVESAPDIGTTFKIALPTYEADNNTVRTEKTSDQRLGILAIDDEKINLDLIRDICETEGITMYGLSTASEALLNFEKHHRDIAFVLLDVNIPGSSCKETVYRLREINNQIPIVLTSGYSVDSIKNFSEMMIDDFLQKPYTSKSLIVIYQKFSKH